MLIEKPLQKFLNDLKVNSGISSATLITEDGLIIASDELNDTIEHLTHLIEVGAISAGILSMAERVVDLISTRKLNQILIKAGSDNDELSIALILTLIYQNIILLILFPSNLNIGLIFYEIEQVKDKIIEYMKEKGDEIILNPESVL